MRWERRASECIEYGGYRKSCTGSTPCNIHPGVQSGFPVAHRIYACFAIRILRLAFQDAGRVSSGCFVLLVVFLQVFFLQDAKRTPCVMPDPVATYK